jgi:signal recognition particle subunit SRP54
VRSCRIWSSFIRDRMTDRILGMGDIMTLIEKAQANVDESKAREMEQKLKKASFGFDDYLESMNQMKKMGGFQSVLSMLPGMNGKMKEAAGMVDEKTISRYEAIILSMTPGRTFESGHPEPVTEEQDCEGDAAATSGKSTGWSSSLTRQGR